MKKIHTDNRIKNNDYKFTFLNSIETLSAATKKVFTPENIIKSFDAVKKTCNEHKIKEKQAIHA